MEAIDISGLNFHQLEELRTRAEQRVTEMRETGAPALREQWTEQAAPIGMTVDEILQAGKSAVAATASRTQTLRGVAKARVCRASSRLQPLAGPF